MDDLLEELGEGAHRWAVLKQAPLAIIMRETMQTFKAESKVLESVEVILRGHRALVLPDLTSCRLPDSTW